MGFLFDVKSQGEYFLLYILEDEEIRIFPRKYPLQVYLKGKNKQLIEIAKKLKMMGLVRDFRFEKKIEYLTGEKIEVLRLDTFKYEILSRYLEKHLDEVEVFNTGIPSETYFMSLTGLFPSARVEISGTSIKVLDSQMDVEWGLPDMRVMEMFLRGPENTALGSRGVSLVVRMDGMELELSSGDIRSFLKELRGIVKEYDPHIVLTDYGDKLIFPVLRRMERAYGIDTGLNMEMAARGVSFVSYGTVFYRAPSYYLSGRWHIDRKNSFMYKEAGLEGIVEISRISRIPVQRLARSAIGTAMSALEYDAAIKNGILIPGKKAQSEDFRPLGNLLTSDKGGLVFTPPVGVFKNVAEIDFSQMYPTIMVKYNISPETIRRYGKGRVVPETGYVIDTRRKGIVPMALEKVLKKRALYKKLKNVDPRFNERQKAIKWILVTCFGYLGYRNARFGKIEAHESVTAIGREILLKAKEIAESRGFTVLHALTDSLWVTKNGMTKGEVEELVKEISKKTGISIDIEGTYRWIAFPSSKGVRGVGVPNRFFGVFNDGRIKIRGLMLRRHDVPEFVKRAQREFISLIMELDNPTLELVKPIGEKIFEKYKLEMEEGVLPYSEFVISTRVRRSWREYKTTTRTAQVLKILSDSGIELRAGEMAHYVLTAGVTDASPYQDNMNFEIDGKEYLKLLQRALDEVINPFTWDVKMRVTFLQ